MPDPQTLRFAVTGLTCGGCAARAERALATVPGVTAAEVSFATHEATVRATEAAGPALAEALQAAGKPADLARLHFSVEGLRCGACAARLEASLAALPFVISVQVNLASATAEVEVLAGPDRNSALTAQAAAAGYPLTPAAPAGTQVDAEAAGGPLARRFALAAVLTLPVVILEMGGHLYPPFLHWLAGVLGQQTLWLGQFCLATAVLAGPGRGFFAAGLASLRQRSPDMNALVALGTGAAWVYSTVATFAPGVLPPDALAVYFEPAALIVTLVLAGRWLEARARHRTGAALRRLLDLRPDTADVLTPAGVVPRPVAALRPGDRVRVAAGARLPADGTVEAGESFVDESMLTGEPVPVAKGPGAAVTGGTVNGRGALTVWVTADAANSRLARIAALVAEGQSARLPIQSLVNRVTLWFVPAVLAIAALTVAAWLVFAPAPALTQALVAGVSVLIISCPCAMGLATPVSIMVGTGRAADLGILFRRGDGLQALAGVATVAFDKTGTLTNGRPSLVALTPAPGQPVAELAARAGALAASSDHPVAQALANAGAGADAVQEHPGAGLTGRVGGEAMALGNAKLMARLGVATEALAPRAAAAAAEGRSVVWIARAGRLAGLAEIADPVRPGAAAAVAALQAEGVRVAMITGDAEGPARAVARTLGIGEVRASVAPEEKAGAVQALRGAGPVAFVGDGINDAPALAGADVGLAIGTGTDVAVETADVVLMAADPGAVVTARALSRATLANIRQNLVWAFGYNVLLIPVAAGVLAPFGGPMLSPVLAAAAMAASSVLVVGNALRLRRVAGAPTPPAAGPGAPQTAAPAPAPA